MKKLIITTLVIAFNTAALADTVIVTETKTWKSVPITVDPNAHTYTTVEGPVPEGDYYYTYSGYRCLRENRTVVGANAIVYHSGTGGGEIYCYPE